MTGKYMHNYIEIYAIVLPKREYGFRGGRRLYT
jgi:hypothetical protein